MSFLSFPRCAQDSDQSVGHYVSVAIEFLTAMKDRLHHIGNSFTLQVGQSLSHLHSVQIAFIFIDLVVQVEQLVRCVCVCLDNNF